MKIRSSFRPFLPVLLAVMWVTFDRDLLPLMRHGLERARAKGFIQGSPALADYRPLGILIGWEVPGMFDADLQIRSLSLTAKSRS